MRSWWVHTEKHLDGSQTVSGANLLDVFVGGFGLLQTAGPVLLLMWFFSWNWFWKVSWIIAGTILAGFFLLKYKATFSMGHFRLEKQFLGIPYQVIEIDVDGWDSKHADQFELYSAELGGEPMRIELQSSDDFGGNQWLVLARGSEEIVLGHSEASSEAIFRAFNRAVRQVYAEKERNF